MEHVKEELPNLTNSFDDNLALLQTSKSNESPSEKFDLERRSMPYAATSVFFHA